MKDMVFLGTTPCDEMCEQVGSQKYDPVKARLEALVTIEQVRREIGREPEGARLRVIKEQHDFGMYYDVVCEYEKGNRVAAEYAFKVEENWPTRYDDTARRQLDAGKVEYS